MSTGKSALYDVANPEGPQSIFYRTTKDNTLRSASWKGDEYFGDVFMNLPTEFLKMYRLDENSTPHSNPFHIPAVILARIMPLECNRHNSVRFLHFVLTLPLNTPFYQMMLEKDSRALLLMAYWYAKINCPTQWCIGRRARMEGPAICMFLERKHSNDEEMLRLLEFPKAIFARARNLLMLGETKR